jgi:tripartite-type tricarboxylate transporter receptor subunit TctC
MEETAMKAISLEVSRALGRSIVVGLALWAAAAGHAEAQSYPNKPVRVIVPYAAGGLPDTVARIIGARLQEVSGQPFLIENKPGAGGIVATETLTKSPADGYTLLAADQTQWGVTPNIYKSVHYDPVKDFAPITTLIATTVVFTVGSNVPANNLKEFVALVKAHPGKYNYGSAGQGSIHHLATAMFNASAGLDMVHVPYKGSSLSLRGMLAGDVSASMQTYANVKKLADEGKLKILGIAASRRDEFAPEVPTFTEQGIKGVEFDAYLGWIAPAGTPKPVVAWLHDELVKSLTHPAVRDRLASMKLKSFTDTPEEFAALIKSDLAKYAAAAKAAGIVPE